MRKLILGFPGVGKTWLKEKYKGTDVKVLDSDSSGFVKSNFPENYLNYIKSIINDFDIILVSTHRILRNEIKKLVLPEDMKLYICYPLQDLKEEWISRLKDRGNSQSFIDLIDSNYINWINEITEEYWENRYIINSPNGHISDFI